MKIINTLLFSLLAGSISAQVGIGTTSPTVALDIEAAGAAIDINNTSTDPLIHFQVSGTTNFTIGTDVTDSKFKIGTTALETATAITVQPTGEVGIGTSSPGSLMEISSGTSGDAVLTISADTDNNDENDNPIISFVQDGGASTALIGFEANAGTNWTNSLANAFMVGTTGAASSTQFLTNNTVRMTIESGGDIGIGTSSPNGVFEVENSTQNKHNIRTTDGTSWISMVPNLGTNSYNDLAVSGDVGIIFSPDDVSGTDASTGLVIAPHSLTNGGIRIGENGKVGVGRTAATNNLEVEGTASKTASGDWLANSDARLKKDIEQMDSQEVLEKMLKLKGVTYHWNDTVTGSKRPTHLQYGFTAQNIQEVFPILVNEDNLGYLQTAYGTYDAMYVESMRALQQQNDAQQAIIDAQNKENTSQNEEIKALKAETDKKLSELEAKLNALLLSQNVTLSAKK